MARHPGGRPKGAKKHKVMVNIPLELLDFVDENVESGEFASRSHAVVLGLKRLKEATA